MTTLMRQTFLRSTLPDHITLLQGRLMPEDTFNRACDTYVCNASFSQCVANNAWHLSQAARPEIDGAGINTHTHIHSWAPHPVSAPCQCCLPSRMRGCMATSIARCE